MDELIGKLKAVEAAIHAAVDQLIIGNKAFAKENWVNIQDTMDEINDLFEST